jgi:reverse gyrase
MPFSGVSEDNYGVLTYKEIFKKKKKERKEEKRKRREREEKERKEKRRKEKKENLSLDFMSAHGKMAMDHGHLR